MFKVQTLNPESLKLKMIPLTSSTKLDIFIHWFNGEGKQVKNKLILSIRVSLLNPKKISFEY